MCRILWAPETDHSAILIHIKSNKLKQKKSPGLWKLNQSLLQDEIYVYNLHADFTKFKQKYIDMKDLGLRWDLIKMEIRGFTIQYSTNKA